MTDDTPKTDRTTTPVCEIDEEDQSVETRTDGGTVVAEPPDFSLGPIGTKSPDTLSPEDQTVGKSPVEGSGCNTEMGGNRSDRLVECGDPSEPVRAQFSQAELNRLRTIASNGGRKSSWVIRRLLRRADETNSSSERSSLDQKR